VHHNFAQRWNEASERGAQDGCWPHREAAGDLLFPRRLSPPAGEVPLQISRTLLAKRYSDATPAPGASPFAAAEGESSGYAQIMAALAGARRSIYIENQAIGSPSVVDALQAAVDRGVEVVFLVPGDAHPVFVDARRDPRAAFYFEKLARLGESERFTLAAIAGSRDTGRYDEIYVHSKLVLVDDAWGMIGSTNIAERSFHCDTELNVSFWDAATATALRAELLGEHLGRDLSGLDDRAALRLFREVALANCDRRTCWEPLAGLAYAVDPRHYGA
jgi:phosphatidylserine/phosphatidylglycerophosphate/cardiolipin synthase-like enzyme